MSTNKRMIEFASARLVTVLRTVFFFTENLEHVCRASKNNHFFAYIRVVHTSMYDTVVVTYVYITVINGWFIFRHFESETVVRVEIQ